MAQAILYSKSGAKKETPVKLNAKVFGATPNHELLGLAYRIYMTNGRVGGAQTLTRGDVRGGGKKPWKQKGTGRARAGSSRLPHWTGGGMAFGPTGEENFTKTLPVKAKRAALRQALSVQANDKKVHVIETIDFSEGKVKPVVELLDKLKLEGNVLIVVGEKDAMTMRATRNIAGVMVVSAKYVNVYNLLTADNILVDQKALKQINEWLEA